jgi:uncharacterized protein YcnI
MKNIVISFAILFLFISTAFAQSHHNFETEKWFGTWQGTLNIYYPVKLLEVPVTIEISKTHEPGKYGWKTSYDNGKIEKSYFLLVVDAEKGSYILDEDNTIKLDYYYADNSLYSVFQVEDAILTSRYTLDNENLVMEVLSSNFKSPTITGKDSGELKEVKSYPVFVTQKAILTKK